MKKRGGRSEREREGREGKAAGEGERAGDCRLSPTVAVAGGALRCRLGRGRPSVLGAEPSR